jgi:UDP-N-acetylmuramate dehydrogenase
MIKKLQKLINTLNYENYKLAEPLSNHTTVKIGGPADIWYEAPTTEDFVNTIKLANKSKIPVTILGQGSNVLVNDKGIRGLVIRNMGKEIKIENSPRSNPLPEERLGTDLNKEREKTLQAETRWQSDATKGTFKYDFKDLDYDETNEERILVQMDSGVLLPYAINYLIKNSISGLQWYAGIPGTIGGAVYDNIHGGTHFLSEVLKKVWVLDENLNEKVLERKDLSLGYDKSRFQKSKEIVTKVEFELFKGDAKKAQAAAAEWTKRKSIQPRNTPGCAFKNISNEDKDRLGFLTTGTGYIIEHILKLTGFHIGDAYISKAHHNFIENKGKATAKDYLAVIKKIKDETKKKVGIDLELEIILLGF